MDGLTQEEQASVTFALIRLELLSEPEKRVFQMIGSCRTHKQAADQLGISAKTIGSHIDGIYDKLGLRELAPGLSQLMLLAKIHLLDHLRKQLGLTIPRKLKQEEWRFKMADAASPAPAQSRQSWPLNFLGRLLPLAMLIVLLGGAASGLRLALALGQPLPGFASMWRKELQVFTVSYVTPPHWQGIAAGMRRMTACCVSTATPQQHDRDFMASTRATGP